MSFEKATQLSNEITQQLNAANSSLLKQHPPQKYLDYLNHYSEYSSYHYTSPHVQAMASHIRQDHDEKILERYHKLILTLLITLSADKLKAKGFPDRINQLYDLGFERILKKIESNAAWYYQLDQDKFLKDLALCDLRLIPTGVRKIELTKLPVKKFIFKKGIRQFFSSMLFIVFELKGIKPIYRGHLDSHDPDMIAEFNAEGWERHYRLVAELLKITKEVKALVGNGWFIDPQLEQITPELNYIREIGTRNGAKLYYIGPSQRAVKRATSLSPVRKKLYEQGKYSPTNFYLVWSRDKIIKWANI